VQPVAELEMDQDQKCTSSCLDEVCELPAGHRGKHWHGGCSWTDQGAERVNKESAQQSVDVTTKA
jgi:hypothetical protein